MHQKNQERRSGYEQMYQLRLLSDGMDEVILSLETRLRESAAELRHICEDRATGTLILA